MKDVACNILHPEHIAKDCPKYFELILEINKLLLLHLVGSSTLFAPTLMMHGQTQIEWKMYVSKYGWGRKVSNFPLKF